LDSSDRVISARLRVLHDNLYYLYTESALVNKFADYEADIRLRKAVERALQVCVEALLDIGRNVIIREHLPQPEGNREVFTTLASVNIIPADLLPPLIEMARFRNLLVHEYTKIDDAKVYHIFKTRLSDFNSFIAAIDQYFASE